LTLEDEAQPKETASLPRRFESLALAIPLLENEYRKLAFAADRLLTSNNSYNHLLCKLIC